jgi:hypothetical protein
MKRIVRSVLPCIAASLVLLLGVGLPSASTAAEAMAPSQASCGQAQFEVQVQSADHPLNNTYRLYGQASAEATKRLLYTAAEGGWFYAACVVGRKGPVLLFQSFCGGSACVEDRYGAVDVKTLKLLLKPAKGNVSNAKAAKALLGRPAPYLVEDKASFCCDGDGAR